MSFFLQSVLPKCVAEVPINVWHMAFTLLSSLSQASSMGSEGCRMLWLPFWFRVPSTLYKSPTLIQQNSPSPSHFLLLPSSHTVEPSSRLLDCVQRCCGMNRRFKILIHQSIIPSRFSSPVGVFVAKQHFFVWHLSKLQLQVFSSQLKLRLAHHY